MRMEAFTPCPCGSGALYAECCGRCHEDPSRASTAEQLMRSRYSAFVLKKADYLLKTWHVSTRPRTLNLADDRTEWVKLEVITTRRGQADDRKGNVEFKAFYRHDDGIACLHEISRFCREQGRWFYLDGKLKPTMVWPSDSMPA